MFGTQPQNRRRAQRALTPIRRKRNRSNHFGIELLESRLFLSATPRLAQDAPMAAALPAPASAANRATIDLLVVYTAQARDAEGGAAGILAQIQSDVADANQAFVNSQIYIDLRLVSTSLINYSETTSASTNLQRLQNLTDGFMDNVGALRDAAGADIVSLYTATADPTAGGIGYVMDDPTSPANDEWGFNVVILPPYGPRYALAHEFGHNLGAGHDVDTGGAAAYSYSHGYRFTAGGTTYRTVMAYDPGEQIPYFSNPNVSYLGVPTGDGNTANNARTLNQTAPIVADYRTLDPVKPTASLLAADPPGYDDTGYDFQVEYSDNIGIRVSTIGDSDVVVTGPGFTRLATLLDLDTNSNGTPRIATYHIDAPGGTWNAADNGTYTVSVNSSQVSDTANNFVVPGAVGSFIVDIKTIPNLVPYQPPTWTSQLVAATAFGGFTEAATIYNDENIYLDWALMNLNPGTTVAGSFNNSLYLDNQLVDHSAFAAQYVNGGGYGYISDYLLGKLAAGSHSLRLVIDADNSVNESNEADNSFTRTLIITARPISDITVYAMDGAAQTAVTDGQAAAISFATVLTGTSATRSFLVRNDGVVDLTISDLTLPPGFSITDPLETDLAPGDSDTFVVTLNTAVAGNFSGTLTITSNDPDENPFTFPLAATVANPDTQPPAASLTAATITRSSRAAAKFTVIYTDASVIYFTVAKHADVSIAGPNRYKQTAVWVADKRSADGHKVTTTYSVTPPGGSWDAADNGFYTVSLLRKKVRDALGHYAAAHALGKFKISIAAKARPAFAAPSFPISETPSSPAISSGAMASSNWSLGLFGRAGVDILGRDMAP